MFLVERGSLFRLHKPVVALYWWTILRCASPWRDFRIHGLPSKKWEFGTCEVTSFTKLKNTPRTQDQSELSSEQINIIWLSPSANKIWLLSGFDSFLLPFGLQVHFDSTNLPRQKDMKLNSNSKVLPVKWKQQYMSCLFGEKRLTSSGYHRHPRCSATWASKRGNRPGAGGALLLCGSKRIKTTQDHSLC